MTSFLIKYLYLLMGNLQRILSQSVKHTLNGQKKYFHIQIPKKITENGSPQKSVNKEASGSVREMDKKIKDWTIEKTMFLQSKVPVGMPLTSVRIYLFS